MEANLYNEINGDLINCLQCQRHPAHRARLMRLTQLVFVSHFFCFPFWIPSQKGMQVRLVEHISPEFPKDTLVKIYKVSSANTTVLILLFINCDKPFYHQYREQQIHWQLKTPCIPSTAYYHDRSHHLLGLSFARTRYRTNIFVWEQLMPRRLMVSSP